MLVLQVGIRRLPGLIQRVAFAQRVWSGELTSMRPLEQPYLETFPGAARCQVTELTP